MYTRMILVFLLLILVLYLSFGDVNEGFVKYYYPDEPALGNYYRDGTEPVGYNFDLIPKTSVLAYDTARHLYIQQQFDKIVGLNTVTMPQDVNWIASTPSDQEKSDVMKYLLSIINAKLQAAYSVTNTVNFVKEYYQNQTRYVMTIFVADTNNQNDTDYSVRFSAIIVKQNDVLNILSLRILDQVEDVFPGYDKYNTKYFRILNDLHLQAPYATSDLEMQVTDDDIKRALEDKGVKSTVPNYLCFGSADPNATSRAECLSSGGYWDTPVVNNADCPYYKKNLNYPNERGGVNMLSGRCEMPLNTKIIGYRYYSQDPVYQPLCYNCDNGLYGPGTVGMCCKDQENRILYPKLAGPDYAFPDDLIDRRESAEYFHDRGVSWARRGALYESSNT